MLQPQKAKFAEVKKEDKASLTDDAEEKDKKMTAREILVLNDHTYEALHCFYAHHSPVEAPTEVFMSQEGTGFHYDGSESDIEQATRNLKAMIEEDGSTHFDCSHARTRKQNKFDELFCKKCQNVKNKMVKALAKRLSEKHNYRLGKDEIEDFFSQYGADQLAPAEEGEKEAMQ
ncbi:hypothetical protein niasHT_000340 [Heterodera trifolii]|uniref:Uncharacterized protein n=1 Tax=Heterodera trifolii TaxID=157864 RepID=A0ABD2MCN1_9BILA